MYCLLCHEKIPRLRAWTTKSEFCSDEHGALYKRQTLERLLTSESESATAELPPAAPTAAESQPQPAEAASAGGEDSGRPGESVERPSPDAIDHLLQLADESGRPDAAEASADAPQSLAPEPASSGAEVPRQSAEEALEALRRLVGDGTASAPAARDDLEEPSALDELNELETAALEAGADLDLEAANPAAAANESAGFAPPELAADSLPSKGEAGVEEELAAPTLEIGSLAAGAVAPAAVDQAEL